MRRYARALCWFRRDLRDFDHAALANALAEAEQVHCVFVLDRAILDVLENRADRRVEFIVAALEELHQALATRGGGLIVLHGFAVDEIPRLARSLEADAVYANRDYEPAAKIRDATIARALAASGIAFHSFKDQAVFDGDEVLTQAGTPFSVFTPYRNAWMKALQPSHLAPHVTDARPGALVAPSPSQTSRSARTSGREQSIASPVPSIESIGFAPTNLRTLPIATGMSGAARMLEDFLACVDRYRETRDFPADARGASNLSMHLRFGTIPVRTLAREAHQRMLASPGEADGASTWLSELIWRDFFFMILDRHPHVVEHAFRSAFDDIQWPHDDGDRRFSAWCDGRTGYPLVDAAMRHLRATGMMHNRMRMITASFLVKDLHVDWRKGERWFAALLNDYDLSANNGNWQWAASTGCDAQPWFRIFNPVTQSQRFDPQGTYIRQHLPELANVPDRWIHAPWKMPAADQAGAGIAIGREYPLPIVDHDAARRVTLGMYDRAGRRAS